MPSCTPPVMRRCARLLMPPKSSAKTQMVVPQCRLPTCLLSLNRISHASRSLTSRLTPAPSCGFLARLPMASSISSPTKPWRISGLSQTFSPPALSSQAVPTGRCQPIRCGLRLSHGQHQSGHHPAPSHGCVYPRIRQSSGHRCRNRHHRTWEVCRLHRSRPRCLHQRHQAGSPNPSFRALGGWRRNLKLLFLGCEM